LKNSTLIQVLKSFSKDEYEKFNEFISSSYFNKAVYVCKYFEKIKEYYPEFLNLEESKEKIFKSLYPGRIYNDATIRKLNSEVLKLAEEFITVSSLQNQNFLKNTLLLEQLDKRKIDSLFSRKLSSSYLLLEQSGLRTEKYFKDLTALNDIEFLFYSMRNRTKGFPVHCDSNENLDKFYIIQKLKKIIVIANESKHRKKIFLGKKEIAGFINSVKKNQFFNLPSIQILYNVFMIIWEGKTEYFNSLKDLFKIHKSEIGEDEAEWIYFTMINFCIIQSNAGKKEFINEELELYKSIIVDNFLLFNDAIETDFYKNIIFCAVEAGDFEFAENFKDKYAKNIFSKDKDYIVDLCNADIAFAKKDYAKALEILAKINFTDVQQKFNLRNLSLKIFYENDMYEQAFLSIDSYRQNLKREDTLPPDFTRLYTTFITLYKKLLKIKLSKNQNEAQLLNINIKKAETIGKVWLLKQSEALF